MSTLYLFIQTNNNTAFHLLLPIKKQTKKQKKQKQNKTKTKKLNFSCSKKNDKLH